MIKVPPNCPLCQGKWLKSTTPQCCICPNSKKCHTLFIVEAGGGPFSIPSGGRFFLKRILEDGTEIWWSSEDFAQIRYNPGGYQKLTFDPPFDVNKERLKLLILFS